MDLAVLDNMMGTWIESSMVQGILRAKKICHYFL